MSTEEIFQVEKILGKRQKDGQDQYLIKWLGYSKQHNTWEPTQNILDPNLVQAFERELSRSSAGVEPKVDAKAASGGKPEKRQRTSKSAPPPAYALVAAEQRGAPPPVPPPYTIELRQHSETLCVLRLTEALVPSEMDLGVPPVPPGEIFTTVVDGSGDGALVVKDRARLVDVKAFLGDERVKPRLYVWAAEPASESSTAAHHEAVDRIDRWCRDLVQRDRAAVVQLQRVGPLGSDLFLVPPKCTAWDGLLAVGATLQKHQLAIALVSADDDDVEEDVQGGLL
jgi:hypothetical protein